MGTKYVKTDIANESTGPGIALAASAAGLTDAYIYANASVTAAFGDGILGTASGHDVMVAGFVAGDTYGVRLGDDRAVDNREHVVIYADGVVNASNLAAVSITGFNSVLENAGDIQGGTIGVLMSGASSTTQSVIRNTGSIFANDYAISRSAAGGDTETILFRNSGYVTANLLAYRGGDNNVAIDQIINTGTFDGDVALGGGADTYDARGGGVTLGTVFGESGADRFLGNAAISEIFDGGADGDIFTTDRTTANGQSDTFRGGLGNDVYNTFAESGDVIVETGGTAGGIDLVNASGNFSLVALTSVENLTLLEVAGAQIAAGNGLSNVLRGNSLANFIDGKGGSDVMTGGAGSDTYYVDVTTDKIVENANQGFDDVYSTATYVLPVNVEYLHLTGTANINGAGNALDNLLYCNQGNNTFNGGLGNDTIYLGGGGTYRVTFNTALGPNNVDLIQGLFANDKLVLDNAIFTGLSEGALTTGAFHAFTNTPAQTDLEADDRIISVGSFNSFELFFDPDGSGAAAMVQFASLTSSNAVTAANFEVI